tara:strand:- start:1796 stop:2011 length:216 start_codon:yes stop_codon:yes gene_type:complete
MPRKKVSCRAAALCWTIKNVEDSITLCLKAHQSKVKAKLIKSATNRKRVLLKTAFAALKDNAKKKATATKK